MLQIQETIIIGLAVIAAAVLCALGSFGADVTASVIVGALGYAGGRTVTVTTNGPTQQRAPLVPNRPPPSS